MPIFQKNTLNENQRNLVKDICSLAESKGPYFVISSEYDGGGRYASVFVHFSNGQIVRYGFNEHGYEYIEANGFKKLFESLSEYCGGHLEVRYEERFANCGHSNVCYLSNSFVPGGGTGLSVYTESLAGDYRVATAIVIYSNAEWKRLQQIKQREISSQGNFKRSF